MSTVNIDISDIDKKFWNTIEKENKIYKENIMASKPLWEETRDLHHACEQHAVGGAMSTGKPPRIWYSAWLRVLYQIHSVIDQYVPESVVRTKRILNDYDGLEFFVDNFDAADKYAKSLTTEKAIAGAIYVLTGAHLMGGEIMRRRLEGFPTEHLEWEDRKEALAYLQTFRTRNDITEEARACFQALLDSMDEIQQRYPQDI